MLRNFDFENPVSRISDFSPLTYLALQHEEIILNWLKHCDYLSVQLGSWIWTRSLRRLRMLHLIT